MTKAPLLSKKPPQRGSSDSCGFDALPAQGLPLLHTVACYTLNEIPRK